MEAEHEVWMVPLSAVLEAVEAAQRMSQTVADEGFDDDAYARELYRAGVDRMAASALQQIHERAISERSKVQR